MFSLTCNIASTGRHDSQKFSIPLSKLSPLLTLRLQFSSQSSASVKPLSCVNNVPTSMSGSAQDLRDHLMSFSEEDPELDRRVCQIATRHIIRAFILHFYPTIENVDDLIDFCLKGIPAEHRALLRLYLWAVGRVESPLDAASYPSIEFPSPQREVLQYCSILYTVEKHDLSLFQCLMEQVFVSRQSVSFIKILIISRVDLKQRSAKGRLAFRPQ